MTTPTITRARCLVRGCGYETTDATTLDLWNGYGDCPNCYGTWAEWKLSDGSITAVSQPTGRTGEQVRVTIRPADTETETP